MMGVHVMGPGLGDGCPPVGSSGKAPVVDLGDEGPPRS